MANNGRIRRNLLLRNALLASELTHDDEKSRDSHQLRFELQQQSKKKKKKEKCF